MKLRMSSTIHSFPFGHVPERQGLLYKKSIRSASYHECWCELWGNLLFCRERHGDRGPPRLIVLEGCTVELQESASEPYTFEISYPNGLPGSRSYKMAAGNQETMEGWVRAISAAGFRYLRVLVDDLESQYRRLKSQQQPKLEGNPKCQMDLHLPPSVPKLEMAPHNMDFTQLHQEFGKDIVKVRDIWQEEKRRERHLGWVPEALEGESLIDFG